MIDPDEARRLARTDPAEFNRRFDAGQIPAEAVATAARRPAAPPHAAADEARQLARTDPAEFNRRLDAGQIPAEVLATPRPAAR